MPYLPPEVWTLVADFIGDDERSLASLCQVSRTFNEICGPKLYRSPEVCTGKVDNFIRTLIQSPHLARQVKILKCFSNLWCGLSAMPRKDLSQVTEDLINEHVRILISLCSSLPSDSFRHGLQATLWGLGRSHDDFSEAQGLWQSMLVSLLPNLEETEIDLWDKTFFATVPSGALPKLKIIRIQEAWDGDRLRFAHLKFLAQAATNLDSLLIDVNKINLELSDRRETFLERFIMFPVFPKVTNLTLSATEFAGLQDNATEFFLSFPLLQSFRLAGSRSLETRSLPKFKSLLRAIASHAIRLKHLSLEGVITERNSQNGQLHEEYSTSTWTESLQAIAKIKTLNTLSIDAWTLWPFKNATSLPDNLLLRCLPESMQHLHIDISSNDGGTSFIDMKDLEPSLMELSRSLGTGRLSRLNLISFVSEENIEEDLSEVAHALKVVGVSLVQQNGPWDTEDFLYRGV